MYRLRNERGAALVLVLWIIVLFTIIGIILFSQLATTSRQMNKQEAATLESDLSHMAAVYVSTYIKQEAGSNSMTQEKLTEILKSLPERITIDQRDITLAAAVESDHINVTVGILIDKENVQRVETIPIVE
ncbi:hypothetical protein AB1K91_14090 [Terribacillus sp. 179-K 1B1 HS]|uniref:hypothetical protein n=1 Tax=Terribacillus sp. 179-K 1B1 HS TaxID=3142388 RepID=UPI0039A1F203